MKQLTFTIATLLACNFTLAQNQGEAVGEPIEIEYCGQVKQKERLFQMLNYRALDSINNISLNRHTRDYIENNRDSRGTVYTIPVVFHIVHLNGNENISDAQCKDAIRIMNEDFRAQNADISQVVSPFQSLTADVEIEFKLAKRDPNGNCHPGITRTYSQNTYDQGMNFNGHPIVDDVTNEHGIWPSESYLNIFVCIDPSGAAGYTLKPGNSTWAVGTSYAGIFINHTYVGAIGTSNYFRGRSLTHEAGHWLNLDHTWGPNNNPGNAASCSDDDDVDDTPRSIGSTSCNLAYNSCSNDATDGYWTTDVIDNVQNYMEYSYCSKMFTQGQRLRMRAAITSSTAGRNNLWTTSNLAATGVNDPDVLCEADFDVSKTIICAGTSVDFSDLSYNNVTSWNWSFPGADVTSSIDQNPTGITYSTPGTYSVTLQAQEGSNIRTETKTNFITVMATDAFAVPVVEGFETVSSLPNSDWSVVNANNDNTTWEITTNAAYQGSKSAYVRNRNADDGEVDELISGPMDLTGVNNIAITFEYAYAQKNVNSADKFSVWISKNCGDSWVQRVSKVGNTNMATANLTTQQFVPTSQSQWQQVSVPNILSSYLVPGFRFKFRLENADGNNLYIDNINISGDFPTGITQFGGENIGLGVYPNPSNGLSNVIFQAGSNTITKVAVYDMLGKEVLDVYNGIINQGEQSFEINTTTLNKGIYLVQVSLNGNSYTKKLIVN